MSEPAKRLVEGVPNRALEEPIDDRGEAEVSDLPKEKAEAPSNDDEPDSFVTVGSSHPDLSHVAPAPELPGVLLLMLFVAVRRPMRYL